MESHNPVMFQTTNQQSNDQQVSLNIPWMLSVAQPSPMWGRWPLMDSFVPRSRGQTTCNGLVDHQFSMVSITPKKVVMQTP